MHVAAACTSECSVAGSIIHFYHFRHWRLTGVAYEVRKCSYTAPNWTLLSTAQGRTKEFKDRCDTPHWLCGYMYFPPSCIAPRANSRSEAG